MPGTIIFKPIEANLTHNTDFLKKMNPYCAFIVGNQRYNSQICKHGGKHPVWNDAITVPITNEPVITLELMDKDKITRDDQIGLTKIDLIDLQSKGLGPKWYPLYHNNKPAGEILLEASFQGNLQFPNQQYGQAGFIQPGTQQYGQAGFVQPGVQQYGQTGLNQQHGQAGFMQSGTQQYGQAGFIQPGTQQYAQTGLTHQHGQVGFIQPGTQQYTQTGLTHQHGQAGFVQSGAQFSQTGYTQQGERYLNQQPTEIHREEVLVTGPAVVQQETFVSQTPIVEQHASKTFVEQRQHVEPHTFIKEVDVVETRPVQQTIEVMEARKVLKEVQYTEAVPVTKTIETIQPQVVTKEVEVMEPRLVTKTIQVVENTPVMKQVEVIESVPKIQAVETFEPQTFTKQVEVIEQVPVMKSVTVTEPVHLKKAVEFVEPIITTQTITKEIRPEVIVNEEVTTSVGPATYVGEIRELSQRFGQITLTEQERARYLGMTEQQRLTLSDEERWRWHEARRVVGSGYNYGTTGSQFVSGTQYGAQSGISGGQFNFSEEDRLRYSKMTEQDLLGLPEQERLRWTEFRRNDPSYSAVYSEQGLGGQTLNYLGDKTHHHHHDNVNRF